MSKLLILTAIAALQFGLLLGLGISFYWDYTHNPVPMMTQADYTNMMEDKYED